MLYFSKGKKFEKFSLWETLFHRYSKVFGEILIDEAIERTDICKVVVLEKGLTSFDRPVADVMLNNYNKFSESDFIIIKALDQEWGEAEKHTLQYEAEVEGLSIRYYTRCNETDILF